MSHFHKSDDVLSEWLAVADKATPPARAPRSSRSGASFRLAFGAVVAVAIMAAIFAPRALAPNTTIAGATPSETAPTTASASASASSETASATPTAGGATPASALPTPGPVAAITLTTPGIATDWHGFSWSTVDAGSPLPGMQVFPWNGGFVAYGSQSGGQASDVWFSSDGLTWTPVLQEPSLLVAPGPDGLVTIATDTTGSQTVWTSSDGRQWAYAGQPQGIGSVTSLSGTAAGLVTVSSTRSGTGKFAGPSQFEVAASSDGVHWTPVEVEPNLVWDDYGPLVQAGNGRFFLMGGLPAGAASDPGAFRLLSSQQGTAVLWWSDDGRSWHRAAGAIGYYGTEIDFGRDGMILHSSTREIPGASELSLSTDGGKTWQAESAFSPLGQSVCGQGECSPGPDGEIGSNGTLFVAVKSDGRAWTSYDGKTWTGIAWSAPTPLVGFTVLPRGVVVNDQYGAAK